MWHEQVGNKRGEKNSIHFKSQTPARHSCSACLWCILSLSSFPKGDVDKFNYLDVTKTVWRSDVLAGRHQPHSEQRSECKLNLKRKGTRIKKWPMSAMRLPLVIHCWTGGFSIDQHFPLCLYFRLFLKKQCNDNDEMQLSHPLCDSKKLHTSLPSIWPKKNFQTCNTAIYPQFSLKRQILSVTAYPFFSAPIIIFKINNKIDKRGGRSGGLTAGLVQGMLQVSWFDLSAEMLP